MGRWGCNMTPFFGKYNMFIVPSSCLLNQNVNRKDETSKVRNIRYIIVDNLCLPQHINGPQLKYVYH